LRKRITIILFIVRTHKARANARVLRDFEKLQNNHYVDKNLDKFWLSFCEQYKEAKLGCVAISFVDRAGDTHPGIDDAETICKEFYEEMSKALNTWYPLPIRVKKS
jgi:hypothetical protein